MKVEGEGGGVKEMKGMKVEGVKGMKGVEGEGEGSGGE